ncbi:MAG TPA: inorganic diphosphatase [Kofleriaceae bacterium]|nr:inorganic diphosphatase [Kofleriaceae bacterium]
MKQLGQRWVNAIKRSDNIADWVPYVCEIGCGSRMKYALDRRSGQLLVHRAMADGIVYPTNYGFIPKTRSPADGGELDLMAISAEPLLPLTIGHIRLVGGCTISGLDENGSEDKLLGIVLGDPSVESILDIGDVDNKLKTKIVEFYDSYKDNQGIPVKVEHWFDRLTAVAKVKAGLRAAKQARKS